MIHIFILKFHSGYEDKTSIPFSGKINNFLLVTAKSFKLFKGILKMTGGE